MPALIERPKMSLAMWGALKSHILKQREKKKQEQEADAAVEQLKKEEEKKRKQDEMTLEEIKDQISTLSQNLSKLKEEKHQLFLQLKRVLHEDEKRRTKETNEIISMAHSGYPGMPVPPPQALYMLNNNQLLAGRSPVMYKVGPPPNQQNMGPSGSLKRARSPATPPPSSGAYQTPYNYKPSHYSSQRNQGSPFYPHTSGASFASYSGGQFPPDQPSGSKHHQQAASFHLPPHLSQQGFVSTLQPQMEHSQKGGYPEEKYYVQAPSGMRGNQGGQSIIAIQQPPKKIMLGGSRYVEGFTNSSPKVVHIRESGGITSGYPVRSQPPTSGSNSVQNTYVTQPRHNYQQGPPNTRYY